MGTPSSAVPCGKQLARELQRRAPSPGRRAPSQNQLPAVEVAALHVLEVALATGERALTAAHPDLDELASPTQWPETAEWLADDAVLVHITALETAVHRYRTHLRARGHHLRPTAF